jgi:uncharacterized protein
MRSRLSVVFAITLASILFVWLIPVGAQGDEPRVPEPIGYVNDYADICTASQEADLQSRLESLETDTTVEVAVVTYPDCGDDPFQFRVDIFNEWGIGKEENDNGLLILVCQDQQEIQQETGYGLEGVLPDILTKKKADEFFVPQAQLGNPCQGLIDLVDGYSPILRASEEVRDKTKEDVTGTILALILVVVVWIGGGAIMWSLGMQDEAIEWWVKFPIWCIRIAAAAGSKRSKFGGGRSGGGGSRSSW